MTNESLWARLAGEPYCYVTTIGRRTGRAHAIEIWFGMRDGRIYLLSERGDRADWVRNLRRHPQVRVRIGRDASQAQAGRARVIDRATEPDLDAAARQLIAAKYEGWQPGQPLSAWVQAALPVEIVVGMDEQG